jgi:hypothetical protein
MGRDVIFRTEMLLYNGKHLHQHPHGYNVQGKRRVPPVVKALQFFLFTLFTFDIRLRHEGLRTIRLDGPK